MLILSRKLNEQVRIGDDITIVVTNIQDGRVRLGIDCPNDVPVHRQEVYDAIQRDKED